LELSGTFPGEAIRFPIQIAALQKTVGCESPPYPSKKFFYRIAALTRCTVPDPTFSSRAVLRMPLPEDRWVERAGLDSSACGTHSMRRTKPAQIYKKTGNLRALQLLLGHPLPGSSGSAIVSRLMSGFG
jgi:hypothetical protein